MKKDQMNPIELQRQHFKVMLDELTDTLGISQKTIARIMSVSEVTMYKWCNGKEIPKGYTLDRHYTRLAHFYKRQVRAFDF